MALTRHVDLETTISIEELRSLIATAGLWPSGNNAKPWRCVAITDEA